MLICRYHNLLFLLSKEMSSSTSNFACQKASFGLGSSTFYVPFLLILFSKSTSLEDIWCNNSSPKLVDGIVWSAKCGSVLFYLWMSLCFCDVDSSLSLPVRTNRVEKNVVMAALFNIVSSYNRSVCLKINFPHYRIQ